MTDDGADSTESSAVGDRRRKRPVEGESTERTETEAVDEPLLARAPEWPVALGAGSLAAATLVTLAGTLFFVRALVTGQAVDFAPARLGVAALQFGVVSILLGLATRFARQRRRWLFVMLAAAAGLLTIVAAPLSLLALVCIGVGRYHFALDTPAEQLLGEEPDG